MYAFLQQPVSLEALRRSPAKLSFSRTPGRVRVVSLVTVSLGGGGGRGWLTDVSVLVIKKGSLYPTYTRWAILSFAYSHVVPPVTLCCIRLCCGNLLSDAELRLDHGKLASFDKPPGITVIG